MSGNLLSELPEDQATGAIAEIYDEVRRFSGVPYVSSLQRYLATMPGVLEWAWAAVRPALVSGVIQETGWRLANDVRLSPLPPVSQAQRNAWRLDMGGLATVGVIAENFVRVSPVNLMTGACLRLLLTEPPPNGPRDNGPGPFGGPRDNGSGPFGGPGDNGSGPFGGPGMTDIWTPPAMLPAMPGNVDPMALPREQRDVLMQFATVVDNTPFIPALYRQLARFPAFLAWLADALVPRLTAPETNTARAAFRAAALAAAPEIVARLRGVPRSPAPDAETTRRVLATIDRYAETSPEMTMFGRLILDVI